MAGKSLAGAIEKLKSWLNELLAPEPKPVPIPVPVRRRNSDPRERRH